MSPLGRRRGRGLVAAGQESAVRGRRMLPVLLGSQGTGRRRCAVVAGAAAVAAVVRLW